MSPFAAGANACDCAPHDLRSPHREKVLVPPVVLFRVSVPGPVFTKPPTCHAIFPVSVRSCCTSKAVPCEREVTFVMARPHVAPSGPV